MMHPDFEDFLLWCFLLLVGVLALNLPGCTPTVEHKVVAPQLDAAVEQIAKLKPPVACRMQDLMPIPDQVHLVIEGDTVRHDEGGEQLLRGYVYCRSLAAP